MRPAVALLLSGCVALTQPYVRTHAMDQQQMQWFEDGPNLVITVGNPTDKRLEIWVVCRADNFLGHTDPWLTVLPPKTETRVMGRVMNRFAYSNPCWVWETSEVQP